MTTLSATVAMRDRWGNLGNIGMVKRSRAVKVLAKPVLIEAATPPATPPQPLSRRQVRKQVKALHRQQTESVVADLRERYPALFCEPPVCFAIGFREQLRAATRTIISDRKLRRAIGWWVAQPSYLEALAAGQQRRNLDGTVSDYPTATHIALAREQLGLPPVPKPRPVLLPLEERARLKARRARLVAP